MYTGTTTYDDPDALVGSRDKMRRVALGYAAACSGVILLGAPLALTVGASPWIPLSFCVLLTVLAVRSIRRLATLQKRLWRVAVSGRHIALLDVSRRQRTVGWPSVSRVEVSSEGVVVVAHREDATEVRLPVSVTFEQYVDLAHHLVRLAERWGRPIWVDGQPLARLDVQGLLPSVRADISTGSAG